MNEFWPMIPILLLAAPFVGSFIGVVVLRLPEGRPIAMARSQCDHCGHPLSAWDLVPLLSWAALRAHCRYCEGRLSLFHPLVEVLALAIAVWAVTATPAPVSLATVPFGWSLLTLALIDARTQRLPDSLTIPLAIMGLIVAFLLDGGAVSAHLIGLFAGFGVFALLIYTYRTLRGQDGLGFGDAKFLGAIGAWITWTGLPTVVFYAGVSGLVYALLRSLLGRPIAARNRLTFGPFLALGAWLVWLYGPLSWR